MNAVEDNDLVPEAELYELFRPRRPEADKFREAVERRIAEKQRERDELEARMQTSAWRTALARRAAAVLPPDVATALFGGKLLATALALPALVLASTVGAFVASTRSLARSKRDAAPATRANRLDREIQPLNRDMSVGRGLVFAIQGGAVLGMLAPLFLGGGHAIDVVVALLVISMAALTISVRGFAQAGLLARGEVAQLCAGLLIAVFMGCFLWSSSARSASPESELGLTWSACVVLAGLLACAWFASRANKMPRWSLAFIVAWIALMALVQPSGWTRSSPANLRNDLTDFVATTSNLSGWNEAEITFEALRSVHAELPDLTHLRAAVGQAIDRGEECHPVVWTAATRMELIDTEHWRTLAAREMEAYKLDRLLASDGKLHMQKYDAYELDMLLATRELTAEQRERLAARIEATWPKLEDERALDKAALCVRLFEALDRSDAIERHRDDVSALLRRHWVSARRARVFARIGGFTSDPDKFRTSFDNATWLAIDLIARVGTPPEIDLRVVRGYLRAESAVDGLLLRETWPDVQAVERAALFRLERQIGLSPRSWLAALLGERVLIGTLLIVALCLIAIRNAPPSDADALSRANQGAQP